MKGSALPESERALWGFPPAQLAGEALAFVFLVRFLRSLAEAGPLVPSDDDGRRHPRPVTSAVVCAIAAAGTVMGIVDEALDGSPWFALTACSLSSALLAAEAGASAALGGQALRLGAGVRAELAASAPGLVLLTGPYILSCLAAAAAPAVGADQGSGLAWMEAGSEAVMHGALLLALARAPVWQGTGAWPRLATLAAVFDGFASYCCTALVLVSAGSGLGVGFVTSLPGGTGVMARMGPGSKALFAAVFVAASAASTAAGWLAWQLRAQTRRVLIDSAVQGSARAAGGQTGIASAS